MNGQKAKIVSCESRILYPINWSDRLQSSKPDNTFYNSNILNSYIYSREYPEYAINLNTIG